MEIRGFYTRDNCVSHLSLLLWRLRFKTLDIARQLNVTYQPFLLRTGFSGA